MGTYSKETNKAGEAMCAVVSAEVTAEAAERLKSQNKKDDAVK